MAPTNHEKRTHQNIVHWFNELMYDLKVFVDAGHPALITPSHWHSWDRYRTELLECDNWGDPVNHDYHKHTNAVAVIDALIADLEAIWYKRPPTRSVSVSRLGELDALYNGLQECKTPTHFY